MKNQDYIIFIQNCKIKIKKITNIKHKNRKSKLIITKIKKRQKQKIQNRITKILNQNLKNQNKKSQKHNTKT